MLIYLQIEEYHRLNLTTTVQPVPAAQRAPRKPATSHDILGLNRHMTQRQDQSIESEVDQYLSDPVTEHWSLQFWQVCSFGFLIFYYLIISLQDSKLRYPKIFPLAMDIIPIQASSVPCERVFSSGKETMAPRRRRIKPGLMEKLQMLKYSIRKNHHLNFTEGLSWAKELKEIEELQEDFTPNEMFSYTKSLDVEDDDGDEDWYNLKDDRGKEFEESDVLDLDDEDDEDDDLEAMYEEL